MSLVHGMLNQTVASICSVTIDGYGDATKSVVHTSVPCRWQEKRDQITTSEGEVVMYRTEMWVDDEITIEEDFRITKDTADSDIYIVVGYEKRYGLDGKHDHTKVFLA